MGKDRQDAEKTKIADADKFDNGAIGKHNAEMIRNLTVNIVENSYGKPYIKMDDDHFQALKQAKADNYSMIYKTKEVKTVLSEVIRPMMYEIYEKLLDDLINGDKSSPIFRHHIDYVNKAHYIRTTPYEQSEPNRIVVDYIASMTDDYFIDLYRYLFPNGRYSVEYKGYFD